MAAYGVGPRLLQLIRAFWEAQKLALRQGGYYGRIIIPGSGITQGGLDSGTLFNILADAVFRAWEAETVEHPVYGNCPIGEILSLIYADDDQLSAMDREWLQRALNILVGMFERMGLKVNIAKTKFMICLPSSHHSHMSLDAYKRKMTGEGDTYRERKRRKVQCPECEVQNYPPPICLPTSACSIRSVGPSSITGHLHSTKLLLTGGRPALEC